MRHLGRQTSRRTFLAASRAAPFVVELQTAPKVRITAIELIPVRATERTVWLIVRIKTDRGLIGLGEASDAFGFANTTKQDALRMESELRKFFALIEGKSPFDIEAYRQKAEPIAVAGGLVSATAYSAIEQALWDLAGQALGVPTYELFGGKIRDTLLTYANINRATQPRTPEGFAATARRAVKDGFRAIKAAPFDGFPKLTSHAAEIRAAADQGIACVAAMREAVGPEVELRVDCHSFFDVPLAQDVARSLEQYNLAWYKEPVAPELTEETLQIRRSIRQQWRAGAVVRNKRIFAAMQQAGSSSDHARRETLQRIA